MERPDIERLADEAVLYTPGKSRPLVERSDTSVFGKGRPAVLPTRRRDQKPPPQWLPPPDHPQLQNLFEEQSEGKFFSEHPWEKISFESAQNEFQARRAHQLRPPYQFRVPAELAPNCGAHRAHFQKLVQRYSVSEPYQEVEFDTNLHSLLTPLNKGKPVVLRRGSSGAAGVPI